jgi:hypothetical protein
VHLLFRYPFPNRSQALGFSPWSSPGFLGHCMKCLFLSPLALRFFLALACLASSVNFPTSWAFRLLSCSRLHSYFLVCFVSWSLVPFPTGVLYTFPQPDTPRLNPMGFIVSLRRNNPSRPWAGSFYTIARNGAHKGASCSTFLRKCQLDVSEHLRSGGGGFLTGVTALAESFNNVLRHGGEVLVSFT